MTFIEAAVVVLTSAGKPLHYKEIAQLAVERDLLSHIGKAPEEAMRTRLSAELRKGSKNRGFVRTGPGTYAYKGPAPKAELEQPPKKAAKEPVERTNDREPAPARAKKTAATKKAKHPKKTAGETEKPSKDKSNDGGERPSANPPVAANNEEKRGAPSNSPSEDENGSERAASRQSTNAAEATSSSQQERKSAAPPDDRARPRERDDARRESRHDTNRSRSRGERRQHGAADPGRPGRGAPPKEEPTGGEAGNRSRRRRKRRRKPAIRERQGNIVDAAVNVLATRDQPVPLTELIDALIESGDLEGDMETAGSRLQLVINAENAALVALGEVPQFSISVRGVSLLERGGDNRTKELVRQLDNISEKLRQMTESQVSRNLDSLPLTALVSVTRACLVDDGYRRTSISGINGETDASIRAWRESGDRSALIVLVQRFESRDERGISRVVAELRGSLHEHDATRGLLVSITGNGQGARVVTAVPGAPNVEHWDTLQLARRMIRLGIGVNQRQLSIPFIDETFFGGLRK